MKKVVLLVLPILFFVFLPSFASAETISVDTIWSPSDGEHIIDSSFSVMASTTLTIMPGTIIKAKSTWYGGPSIYGKLVAHGTSESPIIFTSQNGDVGGWQGLYFKQGSEGDLALDLTPPETQITLTGKKYKEGEFKKEALINFTATDNDSGVLGTWYSINNNDFQKYTKPFIIEGEGLNNLRYYSVDKAGNNEEIKKKEIIIRKFYKYLRKLE